MQGLRKKLQNLFYNLFKIQPQNRVIENMSQPLLVVCGCTGTGKSDLGVEIAKCFGGEIINADSMQIYQGLDIATNKLSREEMQSIPHHLMSFYDPCSSGYHVHSYKDAVLPIIQRILADGKLPILVGGSGYYIEGIIYDNNLIETDPTKTDKIREQLHTEFPTQELLYAELKRVDPDIAREIHKNDEFRVLRALEVFHSTGKTKSAHHRVQMNEVGKKFLLNSRLRFKNTLLIALDARKEILEARLNKRVDDMLQRGLEAELVDFYAKYSEYLDGRHGIMHCIGLKEFMPYLKLGAEERITEQGRRQLKSCCDLVKVHTRQYAQNQRQWFYNRIFFRAKLREVPTSIVLDTSNNFFEEVVPFAKDLVRRFLSGHSVVEAAAGSPLLMPLSPNELFERPDHYEACKRLRHCECCDQIMYGDLQWELHTKGRKHRKMLAARKKRDLLGENVVV